MTYVRREDVVGKKAITPDGNTFGTVKDLAFSMKGDVGLVLSKADGSELTVPIQQASAIGEYILLSAIPTTGQMPQQPQPAPKAAPQAGLGTCPNCGSQMKQGAKFCGKCGHKLA
jgi:sporulation protein YlmC with PRC-barrel domain